MLLWIDPPVSLPVPLCLDPAVYGFLEGPEKLSKCIYIYLLYLYGVSLSRHCFGTYDKAPTAPECKHAERNPFVRLLKGGGVNYWVEGFSSLSGEKDEKQWCTGSEQEGGWSWSRQEKRETSWVWRSIDSHYVDGKKTHTMTTTIYPRPKINKQMGEGGSRDLCSGWIRGLLLLLPPAVIVFTNMLAMIIFFSITSYNLTRTKWWFAKQCHEDKHIIFVSYSSIHCIKWGEKIPPLTLTLKKCSIYHSKAHLQCHTNINMCWQMVKFEFGWKFVACTGVFSPLDWSSFPHCRSTCCCCWNFAWYCLTWED